MPLPPRTAINLLVHLATTLFGEKILQHAPVWRMETGMKLDALLRLSALPVPPLFGMKALKPVAVKRTILVRIYSASRSNILSPMLRLGSVAANGSMGLVLPVCGTQL
jgi:hypothetical protein